MSDAKLLLDIGCTLDWCTQVIGIVKDLARWPVFTFTVRKRQAALAQRVLQANGVTVLTPV